MKPRLPSLLAVAAPLLALLAAPPEARALQIFYEVEQLPGPPSPAPQFWVYQYTLSDVSLDAGQGFSILFHPEDAAGIEFMAESPDWDPIAIQPDPLLPDFGAFDMLALDDAPDPSIVFEVAVSWIGAEPPGAQPFVVYDTDFSTLETGTTVPEPGTGLLTGLGLAGLAALRRRTERPARPRPGRCALRRRVVGLAVAAPMVLAPTCTLEPVVHVIRIGGDYVLRVQRDGDAVRTGRTEAEYQYRGELENTGAEDAEDVIVYVASTTGDTTVLDPVLVFGDVPVGATVASQDTYTISQDRTVPFVPEQLQYQVAEGAVPPMLDFAGTVGSAGGIVDAHPGRVMLDFPAGAVSGDTDIRVSPLENAGFPGVIPGAAYDFGPDGASFDEAVTLTLTYDDTDFPPELDEADLFIATGSQATGDLVAVPSTVDPVTNTVTASISGFSTFVVGFACIPGMPVLPYCPPSCTGAPPASPDDPGGAVDTTFGTDGFLTFDLGIASSTNVRDVLVDDAGRILVGASEKRMAAIRVLPDGEGLDPSFGTRGVALPLTQSDSFVVSMALRSDGRIVLHGARQPAGGGLDLMLARFLPNGVLDPSFGDDGILLDLRQGITGQGQLATLSDGRVLVLDVGARSLFQFLEDGSLDPDFGVDGIATDSARLNGTRILRRATGDWLMSLGARARLFDASGDWVQSFPSNAAKGRAGGWEGLVGGLYVAGGHTGSSGDRDVWVARMRPGDDAGSLEGDDCFGTLGAARFDFGGDEAGIDSVVQPDGRIVVVGTVAGPSQDEVFVVRVRPDGELDEGFGTDGIVRLDFGGEDQANAVAIDAQGRIVVVGSSYTGDPVLGDRVGVVTRLLP